MLANQFKLTATTTLAALGRGMPAGVPAQVADLTAIVAACDSASASIASNARLSTEGKFAERQAAINTAAAAIEEWRSAKVGGLDKQISAKSAALQAKAGHAVPEPTPLRVGTVAQRLTDLKLDPLQVTALYAEAAPEDQRLIEVAAESVGRQPVVRDGRLMWEYLLPPETIAATMLMRAERYDAEGAAQLRDLQNIRSAFDSLAASARRLVTASLGARAA